MELSAIDGQDENMASYSPENGSLEKTTATPSRYPTLSNSWEFAGWGKTCEISLGPLIPEPPILHKRLDQFRATSIAGNDCIASIFYSIGVCSSAAGVYTPICLLLVSLSLYPFKNIIGEVSSAVTLNGGTYSIMLNSTTKLLAAIAAVISLLDYMATSVVSAATATSYLSSEFPIFSELAIFWMTIAVLALFAAIALLGTRDSSTVAFTILTMHTVTMAVLIVAECVEWIRIGNVQLIENWKNPKLPNSSHGKQLFFGWCVGLLGMTGFESAENYIEEMKPNTFPKVMRNLWWISLFINVPITFLGTAIMPISEMQNNVGVSVIGQYAVGGTSKWLRWWICVDAVIVLCAGVLTGFFGATGLLSRLANDHILPSFLLKRNKITGSQHYLVIIFLAASVTMYSVVQGNISSLAGMFAVAFLGTMIFFAIANIFLKYKRGRLSKSVHSNLTTTVVSMFVLLVGLAGNIAIDPLIAGYFMLYFTIIMAFMIIMLKLDWIFKMFYWLLDHSSVFMLLNQKFSLGLKTISMIRRIRQQPVVFFCKTDEIHVLNKAILYVRENELTCSIKLVHLYNNQQDIPPMLDTNIRILDGIYPKMQIDLVLVQGIFDPPTVDLISEKLCVPKSLMFIQCPGSRFKYPLGDFKGVRTIML